MRLLDQVEVIVGLGSILGLLLLGSLVASGSGVASLGSREGVRLFLGNFSLVLIRVCAYIAGLLAVQRVVGFPFRMGW
jgi:hypothetical protein